MTIASLSLRAYLRCLQLNDADFQLLVQYCSLTWVDGARRHDLCYAFVQWLLKEGFRRTVGGMSRGKSQFDGIMS